MKLNNCFKQHLQLVAQYMKFGVVRGAATVVHVLIFAAIISIWNLAAWQANFIAFGIAVVFSFIGHQYFTFNIKAKPEQAFQKRNTHRTFLKFSITTALGLILNSAIALITVDYLGFSYILAIIIMLLIVPPVTFVIAKFWAFRTS